MSNIKYDPDWFKSKGMFPITQDQPYIDLKRNDTVYICNRFFENSVYEKIIFNNVDFRNTSFKNTRFIGCYFRDCCFIGCDFTETKFEFCSIKDSVGALFISGNTHYDLIFVLSKKDGPINVAFNGDFAPIEHIKNLAERFNNSYILKLCKLAEEELPIKFYEK
jgi:hypothetical protein